MNHAERINRCLSLEPIDRAPVALWRHFPVEDQHPGLLAKAIVRFQETFDFDLVKVTPASSFCVKDWGVKDEWKGNPEGTREFVHQVIKEPRDWTSLRPLSAQKGALADQLECIRLIKKALPIGTPVVQTIFSPLSQAKNLVGKDKLATHIRLFPAEIKQALEVIKETTIGFINSCKALGIDGVFYAIQHAQAGILSPVEFDEFEYPLDAEILSHCQSFWLNIAHIHGLDIYFEKVSGLPVQVLNWHDQQTKPSLNDGKRGFGGIVCGGLRQWETLVNGSPKMVTQEAKRAIAATHGERFILGTGCVLPVTAPHANILAVRESVEKGHI
jgi:uroporphyrinogen decarboxylase